MSNPTIVPSAEPDEEALALLNQALEGRYLALEEISRDGSAAIYSAVDMWNNKPVGLRVIDAQISANPDTRAALIEMWDRATTIRSRSEHVVRVSDVGVAGDIAFAAFSMNDTEELHQRGREIMFDRYRVARIMRDVAMGLADAARARVFHGALTPSAIRINQKTQLAQVDFLTALPRRAGDEGFAIGNPRYLAPEVIRGNPVLVQGDIFSLGLIGWEAITSKVPHADLTGTQFMMARLREQIPPIASIDAVPPPLARIIDRCLEIDLARRWPDAGALAAELSKLVSDSHPDLHDDEVLRKAFTGKLGTDIPIGQSRAGAVYQMKDLARNQKVAVRVSSPAACADSAARAAARAVWERAARLKSDHIPRVIEIRETEGLQFVSSEWAEGESLEKRLSLQRTLPADDVRQVMGDVERALADAWSAGIAHGDLKPSCIITNRTTGRTMVDFTSGRAGASVTRESDLAALDTLVREATLEALEHPTA